MRTVGNQVVGDRDLDGITPLGVDCRPKDVALNKYVLVSFTRGKALRPETSVPLINITLSFLTPSGPIQSSISSSVREYYHNVRMLYVLPFRE